MGDEWTENQLLKVAMVVGQSAASKSYLTGLQQFVDLFSVNLVNTTESLPA